MTQLLTYPTRIEEAVMTSDGNDVQIDPDAFARAMADFANGPAQVLGRRIAEAIAPHGLRSKDVIESIQAVAGAGMTAGATLAYSDAATDDSMEAFVALFRSGFEHGVRYIENTRGDHR